MDTPTFHEIMEKHGLTDDDCNREVSEKQLELISHSCCEDWISLPPHLQLDTIVARDIGKSQKGEKEKRLEFLLKWKSIKGFYATYKQLITAELKIECGDEAEKICQILKKSCSPVQEAAAFPSRAMPLPSSQRGTGKYKVTDSSGHSLAMGANCSVLVTIYVQNEYKATTPHSSRSSESSDSPIARVRGSIQQRIRSIRRRGY